jgi:hypothetical protein
VLPRGSSAPFPCGFRDRPVLILNLRSTSFVLDSRGYRRICAA